MWRESSVSDAITWHEAAFSAHAPPPPMPAVLAARASMIAYRKIDVRSSSREVAGLTSCTIFHCLPDLIFSATETGVSVTAS